MKPRSKSAGHTPEYKGVVKKIAGRLTNRPDIEQEGREEMLGSTERGTPKRRKTNPDPHRRG